MGEEDSTDWKKYLILGGAVVGLGVLGYYLFSGDRESERRAMLKEAEHIFDQASGKKEEEDWDSAEQLFGDALALLRRHLTDKNDENIARVVQELSNCALNKMDVDKAEEYSRECLRIKEHIYGKESVEVCESLINLAGVLVALKSHKEALENAQRARRIYEQQEGKKDESGLSLALRTIAAVHMSCKEFEEAEEAARQALAHLEQSKAQADARTHFRGLLESQLLLAKAYNKQSKVKEAEAVYKSLVDSARKELGEADTYVAYSLRNLGDFYEQCKDYEQAEKTYLEALEVVESKFGHNDSNVFAFMNYLSHFYWDTNQPERAQQLYAKMKQMTCLPSPTTSKCLVTRLFAFTFTRSREDPRAIEPVYVGELLPTPKLPADAYLEIVYENPSNPDAPIVQERPLTAEDRETVVLLSPPVKGVKPRMYEIAIHVYADASKTTKISEHHQMCQSVFDTDKIHTEEDLAAQIPKDRMI